MSADILRRASAEIRRDCGDERPFMKAVAQWLAAAAVRADETSQWPRPYKWPVEDEELAALATALAYLGEDEPCVS